MDKDMQIDREEVERTKDAWITLTPVKDMEVSRIIRVAQTAEQNQHVDRGRDALSTRSQPDEEGMLQCLTILTWNGAVLAPVYLRGVAVWEEGRGVRTW
jgi:hypothetical protein